VNVPIRAFARVAELIGAREQTIDAPSGATVENIWQILVERFPQLRPLRSSVRFACHGTLVDGGMCLHEGDELAVLPPSSGG